MALRQKTGGRGKGTQNKARGLRLQAEAAARKISVDPFEVLALICKGELPCTACRGKGKTMYQPAHGQKRLAVRTCESCYGSGKEKVAPVVRLSAAKELAEYLAPKRRAIDLSNTDGTLRPVWEVVLVTAKEEKQA